MRYLMPSCALLFVCALLSPARAAEMEDIGRMSPARGDMAEGTTLYGTSLAALFDGDVETGCTIRQGTAIVRAWAQPVTIARIDFHSYYWPEDKPDNKWIYNYRVSIREGDQWRTISEFDGEMPLNEPAMQRGRCRSGRGYFAGHVQHNVRTGGLPVVTTAIKIEVLKAYKDVAYLREIGIQGFSRALSAPELDALRAELEKEIPAQQKGAASAAPSGEAVAERLLLAENAEPPADIARPPPLVITAGFAGAVTATNPSVPSVSLSAPGGLDDGAPGDEAAFILSRMLIGKQYYRSNDSITLALDTSALEGDVWLEFEHRTSQYGTQRLEVLLDDTLIGSLACDVKPYGPRRIGGRLPQRMLPAGKHNLTFREARGVYYATIDCIRLFGNGLRLVTSDGRSLSADELAREHAARVPHLPERLSIPAGWRAFDFSTLDSPVWTDGGCAPVLADMTYTAERGFGWVAHGTAVQAGEVPRGDALRRDYHFCRAESVRQDLCEFRVDLANGDYHLLIVSGLVPVESGRRICALNINDAVTLTFPFFDRQDVLVGKQSVHHRFASVHVADGSLRLRWVNGDYAIVNGLFIWPAAEDRTGRAAAWRIIEDYYLPMCTEVGPGGRPRLPAGTAARAALGITEERLESVTDSDEALPSEVPVTVPEESRRRGLVVFQRDYDRPLFPWSVPTSEDRVEPPFVASAALGEYEPWQVGVHALRDLRGLTASVSPLRREGGEEVIPLERISLRQGRVIRESVVTHPNGQFVRIAKPLVAAAPVDLSAGTTHLYWVTAHVPDDAPAGRYSGALNISAADGESVSVRLDLVVRPFRLLPAPIPQGMWWAERYFFVSPEDMVEAQFADMAAHGLRTIVLYSSEGAPMVSFVGGKPVFDWSRVDRTLGLLRKHGFTGPIPVYAPQTPLLQALPKGETLDSDLGRQALADLLRGMARKYREYGFDVFFYPVDEPSASGPTYEAARSHLSRMKAVAPECQTFSTCVLASAQALDDWLDVRCYCGLRDGWREAARESGDVAWEYGGIYGLAPNLAVRLAAGLGAMRTGVAARLYWAYCWPKGNEWFDLDNDGKETGAVVPGPDGPVPIVAYECLREGIDDARYFSTLSALVEERNDYAGRAILRAVMESLDDLGRPRQGAPPPGRLRENIADRIEHLIR